MKDPTKKYVKKTLRGKFPEDLTSAQVDLIQEAEALLKRAGFEVDSECKLVGNNRWSISWKGIEVQPHTHWRDALAG